MRRAGLGVREGRRGLERLLRGGKASGQQRTTAHRGRSEKWPARLGQNGEADLVQGVRELTEVMLAWSDRAEGR